MRRLFWLCLVLGTWGCERVEETPDVEIVKTPAGDEMILIPAGAFEMGSDDGDPDEAPRHRVELDAFLIDRFEVRQSMFARLEISNPSHFKGADRPVDNLTWLEAARFCNVRSEAEGLEPCYDEMDGTCDFKKSGYRLPTEAEWEYACRAGSRSPYGFGVGDRALREHGWFADNAGEKTHLVGQKKPNAWKLHDMHGNVAEWCHEPYAADYYAKSPERNPRGPAEGELYVVRGGSWKDRAPALRSAARGSDRPGFGDACLAPDTLGVRCVKKVPAR